MRTTPTTVRPADLVAAAVALSLGGVALAGPEGSQVVRGDASITKNGAETVIRAADRSIINHRSFDIGAGESVRFLQPSADARVLNRITGAAPTRIDGSLSANGRVYIVNPAGVVFGRTATVDVAGLFAAAGKMSDADFVNGVDRVTNMQGRVANEGTIRAARTVTLAGSQVANLGTIVSPQGSVALAAGENVVVSDRGSTMFVRVDGTATGDATTAGVTNTGTIDTSSARGGGRVILAAGDVYGLALRHTGSITAANTQLQGSGRGDVFVEGGTINARNQKLNESPTASSTWQSPPVTTPRTARGDARRARTAPGVTIAGAQPAAPAPQPTTFSGGAITIAGERIGVFDSTFDASGSTGGGNVKIGGDKQGADFAHDPTLQKADALAVNQGTTISADALDRGNGGQVILYADGNTRTNAALTATGGVRGGDGGLVETSGRQHIDVRGDRIDAGVKHVSGKAGVWLIDPRNVSIEANPTTGGSFSSGTPNVFTPTSDSSVLDFNDIRQRLQAGTSVTVTTGGDGTQPGNIIVNTGMIISGSVTTPVTYRLEAANDIVIINNAFYGTIGVRPINFEFLANTVSGTSTDLDPTAGSLTLGDNVTMNAVSGRVLLAGAGVGIGVNSFITSGSGGVTVTSTSGLGVGSGAFFDAGTGNVALTGASVILNGGSYSAGGTLSIASTAGGITYDGGVDLITTTGNQTHTATGGDITIGSGGAAQFSSTTGTISLSGPNIFSFGSGATWTTTTGDVSFTSTTGAIGDVLGFGVTTTGGDITFTAATSGGLSGGSVLSSGGGDISFTSSSGTFTTGSGTNVSSAGGDITIAASSSIALGASNGISSGAGNLTITAGTNLSIGNSMNVSTSTGVMSLTATSGTLSLGGSGVFSTTSGSQSFSSSGAFSVAANTSFNTGAGGISFSGSALTFTSGNSMSTTNAPVSLTATQGAISLGNFSPIGTSGGAITMNAATTLSVGDFSNLNSLAGDITLTAGGDLTLGTTQSVITSTGDITLTSGGALTVPQFSPIVTSGGNIVAQGASISFLGASYNSGGGDISLSATTTITTGTNAIFASSGGDITLSAPTLSLANPTILDHSISGGGSTGVVTLRSNSVPTFTNITFIGDGNLNLETRSPGRTIGVGSGAPGDYLLTDSDLNDLGATPFTRVKIGRSTSGLLSTSGSFDFFNLTPRLALTGTNAAINGLRDNSPVTFDFSGTVNQTGLLDFDSLILRGGGTYNLTDAGNLVEKLAGTTTGVVNLTTGAPGLNFTSILGETGYNANGTTTVTAAAGPIGIVTPTTIGTGGTLRLISSGIDIVDTVSGPGALVLEPNTAGANIAFAAPGVPSGYIVRTNYLSLLGTSLGSLTVGRADGTGTMTVDSATSLPFTTTLRMGGVGGQIFVDNPITIIGPGAGLNFVAPGLTRMAANAATAGGNIIFNGPVVLTTNLDLDTTQGGTLNTGSIIFNDTVEADSAGNNRTLTTRASEAGGVFFLADVGQGQSLGSLAVTGGQASTRSVTTSGNQSYDANVTVSEGHDATAGSLAYLRGFFVGDTSATLNATGNIDFSQAIVDAGSQSLSIRPTAGTARVKGIDIGGIITIEAQTLELAGDLLSPSFVDIGNSSTILMQDVRIATGFARVGVVNSEANEANDLIIDAASNTLFVGDIGMGANGRLGSLSSSAAGTISIFAARINLADNLAIGDACTLANNLEVTAGASITFGGTVDSDATPRSLNVNSSGDTVRFAGLVGNGAALTTLTATGTSIELADDIRTTGAQAYNGPVLLTDDVRLISPAINFASTVDSFVFERNLIIDGGASGLLNFTGAVGSSLALRSLDLTAQQITNESGAITTGAQRYAGVARLAGTFRSTTNGNIEFANDLLMRGAMTVGGAGNTSTQGVTFKGIITSSNTSFPLTVTAGSNGAVRFERAVGPSGTNFVAPSTLTASGGAIDILENITTTGSQLYTGATSLRANLTVSGTGSIGFAGPTTLLSDSTLTTNAGDILFGGTLNSDDTARALIVNTGGNATTRFGGAVGGTNRLSSLTTNADGTTVLAATQVRTINDQIYNDAVRLGTNMTLEANDVVFASTLNSDASTTPRNLLVNTATITGDAGDTTFTGRVGGTFRLGSLTTNADGTTRIGSDIATTRAMTFNDAVVLLSSSTLDSGASSMFFRTTLDADGSATDPTLTLLSNATGDLDAPAFRFGASIGGTRRLGSLTFGADRATPARAASIVFSDAFDTQGRVQLSGVANTDTFNIITGNGGMTIGAGHKLTAFGSVRATSNGTITVGDISALGAIVLNGNAINVRRRPGAEVRLRDRTIARDTGVDFVAGGAIDFNRSPNLIGSGLNPTFTPGNGQLDAELQGFLSRVPLSPLAAADFQDPGNTQLLLALDQRSLGSTRTLIADAILTDTPSIDTTRTTPRRSASLSDLALLAELGIPVDRVTMHERVDALAGRGFDDRLPLAGFLPSRVSEARLAPRAVARVASAYRALALEALTNADGSPVLDEHGQPRSVSKLDALRDTLGASWTRYASSTTQPSGAGWRHALESQGSTGDAGDAAALAILDDAREFLLALDNLGLAPATLDVPRAKVLGELQPAQITDPAILAEAIEGAPRVTVMR